MNFKVILPGGRVREFRWTGTGRRPGVGWRVLVTTSGGGLTGVVVGQGEGKPEGDILEVPDEGPLILPHHLDLLDDLSRDYLIPKGVLLFRLLPAVFDWYQEEFVRVSGRDTAGLDRLSAEVVRYVRSRGEVRLETLRKRFGSRPVNLLIEKGFLLREVRWVRPDLEVRLYKLRVSLHEALKLIKDRRRRELLLKLDEAGTLSEEEVRDLGFSVRTLRSLLKVGILEEIREEVRRTGPPRRAGFFRSSLGGGEVLWGDLTKVVDRLLDLCSGLDGSALILSASKDALGDLIHRFNDAFGDKVVEIHSRVSGRRLTEGWFSCLQGEKVVVGTFLSLLVPLPDLRLVALIDESSPGVKVPAVGIDLRRAVLYLSRKTGSSTILATPAPSVAAYYLTAKEIFTLRKEMKFKPEVKVFRRASSEVLTEEVVRELERENEVLFLVRKEGYSYVYCPRCEVVVRCPECGTFLTLSVSKSVIYCTACRSFKTDEVLCPECEGNLEEMGFGIERAVEAVEKTFGLRDGFHFGTHPPWGQTFETVVILSADSVLSLPTFRAEEEFFVYLVRSYLCARRKFLIQTTVPEIEPVRYLLEGDLEAFYVSELERREKERLPPFTRLLLIRSREDIGGYLRRVLSPDVRTLYREGEGVYDHLVRFRDRTVLIRVADLKRRFRGDIIEVRLDPF